MSCKCNATFLQWVPLLSQTLRSVQGEQYCACPVNMAQSSHDKAFLPCPHSTLCAGFTASSGPVLSASLSLTLQGKALPPRWKPWCRGSTSATTVSPRPLVASLYTSGVPRCTVLHCTALDCTAVHCTVLFLLLYSAESSLFPLLYHTVPCSAATKPRFRWETVPAGGGESGFSVNLLSGKPRTGAALQQQPLFPQEVYLSCTATLRMRYTKGLSARGGQWAKGWSATASEGGPLPVESCAALVSGRPLVHLSTVCIHLGTV